jgi:hypothetical protein
MRPLMKSCHAITDRAWRRRSGSPSSCGGPGPAVGVGVGKRRWYATIFSFDRPRSRSISAERRGRSLSRARLTPRSSSLRPQAFTHASSVIIPAVPSIFHVAAVMYMTTRIADARHSASPFIRPPFDGVRSTIGRPCQSSHSPFRLGRCNRLARFARDEGRMDCRLGPRSRIRCRSRNYFARSNSARP